MTTSNELSCVIETNVAVMLEMNNEQRHAIASLADRYNADRVRLYTHAVGHLPEGYISGSLFKDTTKRYGHPKYDFVLDFGVDPEGSIST